MFLPNSLKGVSLSLVIVCLLITGIHAKKSDDKTGPVETKRKDVQPVLAPTHNQTKTNTQAKTKDPPLTEKEKTAKVKVWQTTETLSKPSASAPETTPPTRKDDHKVKDTSMRALSDIAANKKEPSARTIQHDESPNGKDNANLELSPSDVRDISTSVQNQNLQRSVAQEGATASTVAHSTSNTSQPQCNKRTHKGCDVINFERCTTMGTCGCLSGYLRERATNKCVAAQFFRGEIELANEYKTELQDRSSPAYLKLASQIQRVLYDAFKSQSLRGILEIRVTKVAEGNIIITFEVALNKNNAPRRELLQTMYNRGLRASAFVDTDGLMKLTGTDLILGQNVSMAQFLRTITEYNHCVDPKHNYCDTNAECTHRMRSFICVCRDGFDDVSPDVSRNPGEKCTVHCGCRNNGTCETVDGKVECRCPQWFLGSNCEINGKELLIICCSILGGLLILTVLLCLICVCAVKNRSRKSSRSSTVGMSSLDTSVVKLPRVWMDGTRPYEVPPRDMRRWSYVSEPIRYVDEYMMDDYVHAETLPLPRSHNAKKPFYSAYGNQGYSSSTLNIRSPSRH